MKKRAVGSGISWHRRRASASTASIRSDFRSIITLAAGGVVQSFDEQLLETCRA